MSLNVLQRTIVHGALALSALTGCSAAPRDINNGKTEVVQNVKTLKKRILTALDGLFSSYEKLNKIEVQIAEEMEDEKDPQIKAYNKKRVERCSEQSGGEQTIHFREQMFEVVRPIQEALANCSQLPRADKIECSADIVIATGKGEEYLKAVEGLSASSAQNATCLELTSPRKNTRK